MTALAKTPNPKFYKQDDAGQWWFHPGRPGRSRTRAHVKTCEQCDQQYVISVYTVKASRFCSRQCSGQRVGREYNVGPESHKWRGGRRLTVSGYVEIWVAPNERTKVRGYSLEHRLVMEEALGRKLTDQERVHHKNGIKTDNRLENLELWTTGHSMPGIRVDDMPKHCPTCTCGQHET